MYICQVSDHERESNICLAFTAASDHVRVDEHTCMSGMIVKVDIYVMPSPVRVHRCV